jgi:hypothetical protein
VLHHMLILSLLPPIDAERPNSPAPGSRSVAEAVGHQVQ